MESISSDSWISFNITPTLEGGFVVLAGCCFVALQIDFCICKRIATKVTQVAHSAKWKDKHVQRRNYINNYMLRVRCGLLYRSSWSRLHWLEISVSPRWDLWNLSSARRSLRRHWASQAANCTWYGMAARTRNLTTDALYLNSFREDILIIQT
jgi:hypothetical protein